MNNIIPYGKQEILQEDIDAVISTLTSDYLTQGPKVKEFEESFANYVGAKYAVAVTNGTAALHLSSLVMGVGPGKKVITTPLTFVASANCVLYCGGDIQLADIDPKTFCLDPNKVEDLIKKYPNRFQGIIPVDFAGYPLKMDDFKQISNKYNLWIIEDACHAPGASFVDNKNIRQRTGNSVYADLTVFSFHPVKHIACGEGGMITTNDYQTYKKLLLLRTHGITKDPTELTISNDPWFYEMQELGYNYRISDILCSLGVSQLKRAQQSLNRRKEIANRYLLELKGLPLELPTVDSRLEHAFHLFVIKTENRKKLYEFLKKSDIHCQVHYIPVHRHPFYIQRYGPQEFSVADDFYTKCLSLPIYHSMTEQDQDRVINSIKLFFGA